MVGVSTPTVQPCHYTKGTLFHERDFVFQLYFSFDVVCISEVSSTVKKFPLLFFPLFLLLF